MRTKKVFPKCTNHIMNVPLEILVPDFRAWNVDSTERM